jgi:hypothetical protein
MIGDFFTTLMNWLQTAFTWILDGSIYCLKFVCYFVFDGLLTAVSTILLAIDISSLGANLVLSWSGLPTQLIYLINACGIPAGLSLVVSAIIIRMGINLIPAEFTRI